MATEFRQSDDELELELQEWLDSLDYVLSQGDPSRVERILRRLRVRAEQEGIDVAPSPTTP